MKISSGDDQPRRGLLSPGPPEWEVGAPGARQTWVPAQGLRPSDGRCPLGRLGTEGAWPTGALSPGLHSVLGQWVFLPLVCTFRSSVDF